MLLSPHHPTSTNPANYNRQTFAKVHNQQQKSFTPSVRPHPHRYARNHTEQRSDFNAKKSSMESVGHSESTHCQRVFTEEQTNDLYQQDFQELDQSIEEEGMKWTVQEQNQSIPQICKQQLPEKEQDAFDKYEFYSVSHLNRCNQKLIQQIQFMREAIQIYRINGKTIQAQREQLKELKNLKKRAIDFSYELELDRQTRNKTDISKSIIIEMHCASGIVRKQRYKTVKEGNRRANPTNFELQYSCNSDNPGQQKQLLIARQQLLSKKRQFYQYQQQLQILVEKVKQYDQLLDMYQIRLSRGNIQGMLSRKKQLQSQIIIKKAKFQSEQLVLNIQINGIINDLAHIETQNLKTTAQSNRIKTDIVQIQSQLPKTSRQIQARLQKSRSKTKPSKKLIKLPQAYIQDAHSPKAILRYFYNPHKNRNSNLVRVSQV